MKFLNDILAKAGLVVDGVVSFNNTATGQTPSTGDSSTNIATTAFVKNQGYVTSGTSPIISSGGTISIPAATGFVNGYLTSADWNTFNNKANAPSGTSTQVAYFNESTTLTGSSKLIWDNTNGYLVNQGYYFLDFAITYGGGVVARQQGTGNMLMQMGFNAQGQYGGTPNTLSGNQFHIYNFQGAGYAANYYWGFNNSGDNFWGSSNTLYSVKIQQPAIGNIPLSILGRSGQTANLFNISSYGSTGDILSITSSGATTFGNSLTGTSATFSSLSGTGTRMVVSDSNGLLSTLAIPSGGGAEADTLDSVTGRGNTTSSSVTIGSSTAPVGKLTIDLANTNYTNTGGAGAHLLINNTSATGQNVVSSMINGSIVAKWRTDYVGNISWVAGGSGVHDFYTGGDFGTGTTKMSIKNNGNIQMGAASLNGSFTDNGYRLEVLGTMRVTGAATFSSNISATTGFFNNTNLNHIGLGPITSVGSIFNIIGSGNLHITNNSYYNAGFLYSTTNVSGKLAISSAGSFTYSYAPSGTINTAVTYADVFTVTSGGAGSFSGTITASNFSGSHSGTSSGTNTGDQTNISGTASNITAYTINQSVGTGNSPTFVGQVLSGRLNFGNTGATPYSFPTDTSVGISFGGWEGSSLRTYGIFTEKEYVGGDYSKLTFNYHTGIRLGASYLYGGTRFYNNFAGGVGGGTEIFSVGNGDNHVRVANNLYVTGTITASNFSGTHSGTSSGTNTGDQTNISGNAATATTAARATRANGYFYMDDNYGNSLIGVYSSTAFQGIFAMGDAYKTTAAGGINNLYGLAWSHPNAGGQAANLSNHGLIIAVNGITQATISNNIWILGQFKGAGTGLTGTAAGLSVGGTAGSISGFNNPTTAATANTIVYRDANGYITNSYFYASGGGAERSVSGMGYFAGHNSSDYYYRSFTAAAAAALLSGKTMNIVGTSTNITAYTINQNLGTLNAVYFDTVQAANNMTIGLGGPTTYGSITMYGSTSGSQYWGRAQSRNTDGAFWLSTRTNSATWFDNVKMNSSGITIYGTLTNSSDIRFKTNIETIEGSLDKVLAMRGITYNRVERPEDPKEFGFVAQELLPIIPEVVHKEYKEIGNTEDFTYSVSYTTIPALLIEAMKELNTKLELAYTRITQLENK